jgi:hypothetical protein
MRQGSMEQAARSGERPRAHQLYGEAITIDSAQSTTVDEHILSMAGGSRAITSNKGYVANSRHTRNTWLVISDAAERREVYDHRPRGSHQPILEHHVWENVETNLSRGAEKRGALALLERAGKGRRQEVGRMQEGCRRSQQRLVDGHAAARAQGTLRLKQIRRHIAAFGEHTRETAIRVTRAITHGAQRIRQSVSRRRELQQAARQRRGPSINM